VTRWKRDDKGNRVKDEDNIPILQFVAIQRRDTKQWAIPGVNCCCC
jgi:ADP-ribose pyrophosphatase